MTSFNHQCAGVSLLPIVSTVYQSFLIANIHTVIVKSTELCDRICIDVRSPYAYFYQSKVMSRLANANVNCLVRICNRFHVDVA
jgi:hypothetical protein